MYFNNNKVHLNVPIEKVWGGPNSGLDGGKNDGYGISNTPGTLIILILFFLDMIFKALFSKPEEMFW